MRPHSHRILAGDGGVSITKILVQIPVPPLRSCVLLARYFNTSGSHWLLCIIELANHRHVGLIKKNHVWEMLIQCRTRTDFLWGHLADYIKKGLHRRLARGRRLPTKGTILKRITHLQPCPHSQISPNVTPNLEKMTQSQRNGVSWWPRRAGRGQLAHPLSVPNKLHY